jgi:hypothetical protein
LIVRVLVGRVNADRVPFFREQASLALGRAREHPGCIFAQVGRQAIRDGSEEIAFVSAWTCLNMLYDWIGGSNLLESPAVAGQLEESFEHFDIQHYEVVELAEAGKPALMDDARPDEIPGETPGEG